MSKELPHHTDSGSRVEPRPVGSDPLLDKICAQLDTDAAALDAATQSRLNQARATATAQLEQRRGWLHAGYWWAGSVAASALLVVIALQYSPGGDSPDDLIVADRSMPPSELPAVQEPGELTALDAVAETVTQPGAEDSLEAVAMLAEEEALDFYAELGFLEWLDQQEDAASLLDVERETSGLAPHHTEFG